MLNSSRWLRTSPGSGQAPDTTSTGVPNRDEECIIKQEAPPRSVEAEDSGEAPGSPQASTNGAEDAEWSGVSAAAARAGLYDEHEVKDELVLGPERLQPQDIAVVLAVASNSAEKDSVEQEPVQNIVKIKSTKKSILPVRNLHLNSLLEQLVHSTCYVRLERTPVSKELTCQTPHKSLDLSSRMSDKNKHTEETDVNRNMHQKSKVPNKRNSFICDFCGKQFAQKTYFIKHIRVHMEQNADTLHRMSSDQDSVKCELIKQQCSRGAGQGPRSVESLGEQVALRTCCVRLERILIDKHQHQAVDHSDNGYVSNDSAVDTKITKKPYCDICNKDFSSFNYLKKHITKHLWEKEFACEICKQKFPEKCHLIKHIEEVHRDQEKKRSKKVYSCKFCNKVLCSMRSVTVHERIHTGEKPFGCDVCKKQFVDRNSLLKHIRIHTGEKPFACDICSKRFKESGQMTTHRRMHATESKKHTCEICEKQCISLKAHMVIHTRVKTYVCEFCGKSFNNSGTLLNHRRTHKSEEYFACEVCKRQFRLQENLERHKQSCTLLTCDVCMKQFRQRSCLREHKRVHTGEKPYACEICQASYFTIRGLVFHKRRHLEKPFTCDICKKQFRSKEMIIAHIPIHTRMGRKPYVCEICQKAFARFSQMSKHKTKMHSEENTFNMHTGEKPYKCEICQKPFARYDHVLAHQKIHSKKPFTCDICTKSFKTKHKMLFHINNHATGEESYACEICHKPFTTYYYLLQHNKIHTEKPFNCRICKRSFITKQKMLLHIHTHTTVQKSYACEICHKPFTTYSNMLHHKKIHTEKRFTCDICNNQFRTKHMIIFHMQTHTGEKPSACEICLKPFSNARHVLTHKKLHSEKPFTCDHCKISFETKDKILLHMRTHIE